MLPQFLDRSMVGGDHLDKIVNGMKKWLFTPPSVRILLYMATDVWVLNPMYGDMELMTTTTKKIYSQGGRAVERSTTPEVVNSPFRAWHRSAA
jgi:hypothetical protein